MERKATTILMLTLLLISMLTLILNSNIQPARATGTIYIRADGSIDPSSANITTSDYFLYTFTDNNHCGIVVERDNIVIDGKGYTLQVPGSGNGFYINNRISVTIKNTTVDNWTYGFLLNRTLSEIIITENNVTINYIGVNIYDSSNYNVVYGNIIANNTDGIDVAYSDYNNIFDNNVTNNSDGIWIGPYANNNARAHS